MELGYIHGSLLDDPRATLPEFCLMEIAIRTKWGFTGKRASSPAWPRMWFSRMLAYVPQFLLWCSCSSTSASGTAWLMVLPKTHLVRTEQNLCLQRGNRILCPLFNPSIYMLLILNTLLIWHRQFTSNCLDMFWIKTNRLPLNNKLESHNLNWHLKQRVTEILLYKVQRSFLYHQFEA